jgi:hypothetical protein
MVAFRSAQALLLAASGTRGEKGKQEDDKDWEQRSGAGGEAENDGEQDSREGSSSGYGAQAPSKKGKCHGKPDGGDQVRDGDLPALKEIHAQIIVL